MSRYIRALACRSFLSADVPKAEDWTALLKFEVSSLKPVSSRQFLKRIQLESKVTAGAKIKAEQEISERSGSREGLEKAVEKIVDNFALTARNYVTFLIESTLGHVSITADITRGLASFDPQVLFVLPTSYSYSLFTTLYRSFSSRGWVKDIDEQLCLDQYISFVEEIRSFYPDVVEAPDLIFDVVSFLATSAKLQSRPLLHYVFLLSGLCLTEAGPVLPVVKFGTVDSSKVTCGTADVIFPVQSYLSSVPDGGEFCSRGSSVDHFVESCATYGQLCSSDIYDVWSHVDFCGRQSILDKFLTAYRKLSPSGAKKSSSRKSSASSTVSVSKTLAIPKKVGHVNYGAISSKEVSKAVSKIAASSSNP